MSEDLTKAVGEAIKATQKLAETLQDLSKDWEAVLHELEEEQNPVWTSDVPTVPGFYWVRGVNAAGDGQDKVTTAVAELYPVSEYTGRQDWGWIGWDAGGDPPKGAMFCGPVEPGTPVAQGTSLEGVDIRAAVDRIRNKLQTVAALPHMVKNAQENMRAWSDDPAEGPELDWSDLEDQAKDTETALADIVQVLNELWKKS